MLPRSFFARPTLQVAREILGARLVHLENGLRLSGIIVEAEAYVGETDLGCHAKAGRTPRTEVMYGPPGFAYVYFTYGMHWLFNVITEEEGFPAAVLIRAVAPLEGLEIMAARRAGRPRKDWANGPAKLTQAMGIGPAYNGIDLCAPDSPLIFESDEPIPDSRVTTTPRVGLYTVPEPWKSIPWRFLVTPH
ncbi:MAG TPA: DNA-3-methyladenine glycosylase [Anaerolineales bacterium]|nr:DNA-3-methyladenine glycosylase [Anaerolineales bacterium]